jgi:tetratricopeptide (TPR) repeat protein
MGRTFYLEGKVEEAIAAYEKVLSINESLAPAANDLAYIYAESERNLERALSLAFKAKEIQPQNPDILDTLGWVQFKKGLAAHAEKNIREAVGKRPLEPLFHYHLGVISYKGGRYQEAISFFKESLRLGLEDEEAGKAGILMEKMNRRDEALKTAEIHAEVGESGKAVEICEGILREGYYWKAAVLLASLYADTNENLDRALSLAKEVSDAFPEYARAAGTLGWVLLKKGSRQTAGRYLHKAVIADPDDPMAHYRLGVFYYEGKAFGDASRELERAVKIGLEKRWADNARRILDEIRRQDSQETG